MNARKSIAAGIVLFNPEKERLERIYILPKRTGGKDIYI